MGFVGELVGALEDAEEEAGVVVSRQAAFAEAVLADADGEETGELVRRRVIEAVGCAERGVFVGAGPFDPVEVGADPVEAVAGVDEGGDGR